jgi:hypothetical protein
MRAHQKTTQHKFTTTNHTTTSKIIHQYKYTCKKTHTTNYKRKKSQEQKNHKKKYKVTKLKASYPPAKSMGAFSARFLKALIA